MSSEDNFLQALRVKTAAPFDPVEFFKHASFAKFIDLDENAPVRKVANMGMPPPPALPMKPAGAGPMQVPGFSPDKMTTAFTPKDPVSSAASPSNINMRSSSNEAASSINTKAPPNPTGFQGSGAPR